jgi:twitching motility two-component system response regulator PilG
MGKTVLVIDKNSAVQAITSTALEPLGVHIQGMTDASNLFGTIRSTTPSVILASEDMPSFDPCELFIRIKRDKSLSKIKLVLLATGEISNKKESIAKKAGADAVISKPFRSAKLRALIEDLLKEADNEVEDNPGVALIIPTPPWGATFARLLEHRGLAATSFADTLAATTEAKLRPLRATVVESEHAGDYSWYDRTLFGDLIVLSTLGANETTITILPENSRILQSPLSYQKIDLILSELFPESSELYTSEREPLEPVEQAGLAAQLSAHLFELLLSSEALKERRWQELAHNVEEEMIRVCTELDKT